MYLLVHTTYTSVDIALCHEGALISTHSVAKHEASATLIVEIDTICTQARIQPTDLDCIVASIGPAPFTTLRTSITTANGIAFACGLKLVGVDGLSTFVSEHQHQDHATVALLNAYACDLYYAIAYQEDIKTGILYGLDAIKAFLQTLPAVPCEFIGNGVSLYQDLITATCGAQAIIQDPLPDICSLHAVARQGWLQWQKQEHVTDQLSPLYLKNYSTPLKSMQG